MQGPPSQRKKVEASRLAPRSSRCAWFETEPDTEMRNLAMGYWSRTLGTRHAPATTLKPRLS